MSKSYLGIIGAILAGAFLIAGSILYTGPKMEAEEGTISIIFPAPCLQGGG
jgi:hypothetical protein